MVKFKKIMLVLLSLATIYTLYSTIGYLVLGIKTPHLVGATTTNFTGMFIMSATFGGITLLLVAGIIFFSLWLKKDKR